MEKKKRGIWKTILIILTIVIVLGIVGLAIAAYSSSKKIKFSAVPINIDFQSMLSSLFSLNNTIIPITLQANIKNDNNFALSFSNLYVEILYNDVVIAKSSDDATNFQKYVVDPKSELFFDYIINAYSNDELRNVLKSKILGNKVNFKYKIKIKIFGWIPYNTSRDFEY